MISRLVIAMIMKEKVKEKEKEKEKEKDVWLGLRGVDGRTDGRMYPGYETTHRRRVWKERGEGV